MEKSKKNDYLTKPCEIRQNDHNGFINLQDLDEVKPAKPTLLLHSCCGPCSTAVVERLGGNYEITIYFYNPNITDREEYERRKEAQISFIDQYNGRKDTKDRLTFIEGPYDPENFYQACLGFESEKEGGRRCNVCFQLRLEKTAEVASISGFDCFSTTLSVSPHKDFDTISAIGKSLGVKYGLAFLNENFKKKDGYKRSIELSREYHLYRQNYCGCSFSKGGE